MESVTNDAFAQNGHAKAAANRLRGGLRRLLPIKQADNGSSIRYRMDAMPLPWRHEAQAAVRRVLRRRGVRKEDLEPLLGYLLGQAEALYVDWPVFEYATSQN